MKKHLLFAAFALLAMVACEDKQSFLDLDNADVKLATVVGQVTYNPGGADAKKQPADSVEVRVLVANSEFSGGAQGEKQFGPVYTDANGMYEVTIPVGGLTLNAANVKIQVMPTEREYTNPNDGTTSKIYFTSNKMAIPSNLTAGDVVRRDIEMKPQLAALSDFTSFITVSGVVSVDAGYQKESGTNNYEKKPIPYGNKELVVKGMYSGEEIELASVITDANGAYSFDVPAGSLNASITISTVRFDGKYTKGPEDEYESIAVFYRVTTLGPVAFNADTKKLLNQNITIAAYDEAEGEDLSKKFEIKRLTAIVKTYGEVYDESITSSTTGMEIEEVDQYKWDAVFLPFDVTITLSSNAFDAANPSSLLKGAKLVFNTQSSAIDGKVELSNIKVYTAWEGYAINATLKVEEKLEPLKHIYYEFNPFSNARYHTKTWADWHIDATLTNALIPSFWSNCWPSTKKEQLVEGYYQSATSAVVIPAATLKYYGEYEYPSDVEVTFVARDTKTIKGIWGTGVSYTNRNDKDANGNYTPMEITEEAKDASEVQLLNSILTVPYATRQKIRYHDKYQGACRLHWNPGSL